MCEYVYLYEGQQEDHEKALSESVLYQRVMYTPVYVTEITIAEDVGTCAVKICLMKTD